MAFESKSLPAQSSAPRPFRISLDRRETRLAGGGGRYRGEARRAAELAMRLRGPLHRIGKRRTGFPSGVLEEVVLCRRGRAVVYLPVRRGLTRGPDVERFRRAQTWWSALRYHGEIKYPHDVRPASRGGLHRTGLRDAGHDAGTTDRRLRSTVVRGVTLAPGKCISRMSSVEVWPLSALIQIPISKVFPRPVSISSAFSGVVVGLSVPLSLPPFAVFGGPRRGMPPAFSSDEVLPPALRTS